MNSKRQLHGILLLCSLSLLSACGDNFTAGVSLGGSGSGANKPDQNGGPNVGNAGGDKNDKSDHLLFEVPKSIADSCYGLERELRITHKDDDKLLLTGDPADKEAAKLVITLYNNTAQPIFERTANCLPISVTYKAQQNDVSAVNVNLENHLTCPLQSSIQVWQPFEKREYSTSVDFMNQIGNYTIHYQSSIGQNWDIEDSKWMKCKDLPVSLDVKVSPNKNTPTKDDLDQKNNEDKDTQMTIQPVKGDIQ